MEIPRPLVCRYASPPQEKKPSSPANRYAPPSSHLHRIPGLTSSDHRFERGKVNHFSQKQRKPIPIIQEFLKPTITKQQEGKKRTEHKQTEKSLILEEMKVFDRMKKNCRSVWVAIFLKHRTLGFDSGGNVKVVRLSPALGSMLSFESACPSPLLLSPLMHSLSL